MRTPVAFLIFNRPDTTKRVFEAIRQAKPSKLLVVADGPRKNRPDDKKKCADARAVIERVDWDCQVLTNYSDTNLGCKQRVSSGLDWVFSQVEEAIIIEDDCIPHLSFFRFCEELLEYYRDEEKVWHIAGTNLTPISDLKSSFLFSRLVPIWGWATWKRAWQHYDIEMKLWSKYKHSEDLKYFGSQQQNVYQVFENNYHSLIDTWDGQWAFSCVAHQSLSIIPKTNLVTNIGFRSDATHTKGKSKFASIPVRGLDFPLVKPLNMIPNQEFDEKFLSFLNGSEFSLVSKIKQLIRKTVL
ncbi:MAG: glycosyltransferase family 2 protein [Hydrococcus sp. C42_A2020_068]|uniref:hypothetical protein n=1 Tax=Pleurocapsa sp. PCC 7327 TaxID=118163 RepID=UPI00029FD4CE|nr:hypothetical protein [Pleurocapsa sp. PCC 7327]AFY79488.1 hypothetical protein Ple7327_4377 [Pleurocapsa sp. PCC 7327]MBF2021061.1 glycosyltransferase family 2 protein [Hydrococcus sp. C42_A2020_068]